MTCLVIHNIETKFIFIEESHINHRWLSYRPSTDQLELDFENVSFCGGRKTGEPGEKPSERGQGLTTSSTLVILNLEPGHTGGRQALALLQSNLATNTS